MTRKALYACWLWTSVLAVAVFAVLALLDLRLKAETGFGTVDLQKASSAFEVRAIMSAWIVREHALTAGFNLGFDYLFMPLYAFAFYFGALAARENFAPHPGLPRRALALLAAAPLAGALFDATENGLETAMLIGGPTDALARLALTATTAKTICFVVGLIVWALGLISLFARNKPAT